MDVDKHRNFVSIRDVRIPYVMCTLDSRCTLGGATVLSLSLWNHNPSQAVLYLQPLLTLLECICMKAAASSVDRRVLGSVIRL